MPRFRQSQHSISDSAKEDIAENAAAARSLQICMRHREFPTATYDELSEWACIHFNLFKKPSKQVFTRVLKGKDHLRTLSADCLSRKKSRPPFQLDLDQSIVEFVIECANIQLSLTGRMTIAQAKKLRAGSAFLRQLNHGLVTPGFAIYKLGMVSVGSVPMGGLVRLI
ncbi:unnamed protein product [Phytophthora fragariaefolia]|uniref:Unnamed protein product n=1 Tax=Phytophthora fragariaefolia TaxID=1490495 RepID=A0A9W6Y194_9STRA|nr:unnamed protein product [Phytophthora fragariaefolia]